MTAADDRDWLVSGAKVAIIKPGSGRATFGAVERLTATQVIAGGRRFRRSDLRLVGDKGDWPVELRPVDDPEVRLFAAREAVKAAARRIRQIAEDIISTPADALEALDHFEAAIDDARRELVGTQKSTPPGDDALADIAHACDHEYTIRVSPDLPAGHFTATGKAGKVGITTEYLLSGTPGDPSSRVVGRVEYPDGSAQRAYTGGRLKGGRLVSPALGVDLFAAIAEAAR